MIRFFIRRIILLFVTLFVTSAIVFGLTQLLPGDIALLIKGRDASQVVVDEFRETHGLDAPVLVQYSNWLGGFATGDWGKSYLDSSDVRTTVMRRLGNSLQLAGLTLLLAVPISIVLGVVAAVAQDTWLDGVISVFSLAVVGLPEFVTGLLFLSIFAPGAGWPDWFRDFFLPALTATLVLLGYIARMTRAGVIEELRKPYVRTARLKGLSTREVLFKHVLRNALLPTITVIAISVGWLIGGLVVIENVFNYFGVGLLLVEAVERKNMPIIMAATMIIVFFFAFSNMIADLLYAMLNPRIRLG
ncbi:MAG: ABC transporter permease [Anaerolineae bacterium]|nr:ABC transporter permease [Anaerolineae bacterium]MCA9896000.1 ABC transporter permease [Anaerolineae bacterium]